MTGMIPHEQGALGGGAPRDTWLPDVPSRMQPMAQPVAAADGGVYLPTPHEHVPLRNTVVCSGASGGIGTSVCAALLAACLADVGVVCSLVDVDVPGGGMDVLLGIEHHEGLRGGDLPSLGSATEAERLRADMPRWHEVAVLATDAWRGGVGEWWTFTAAVRALDAASCVVVDAGRGEAVRRMEVLGDVPHVVMAELSVLGLARAKEHCAWLRERGATSLRVVLVEPFAVAGARAQLSVDEAADYVGETVAGVMPWRRSVARETLQGMGVPVPHAKQRAVLESIIGWLGESMPLVERCGVGSTGWRAQAGDSAYASGSRAGRRGVERGVGAGRIFGRRSSRRWGRNG